MAYRVLGSGGADAALCRARRGSLAKSARNHARGRARRRRPRRRRRSLATGAEGASSRHNRGAAGLFASSFGAASRRRRLCRWSRTLSTRSARTKPPIRRPQAIASPRRVGVVANALRALAIERLPACRKEGPPLFLSNQVDAAAGAARASPLAAAASRRRGWRLRSRRPSRGRGGPRAGTGAERASPGGRG